MVWSWLGGKTQLCLFIFSSESIMNPKYFAKGLQYWARGPRWEQNSLSRVLGEKITTSVLFWLKFNRLEAVTYFKSYIHNKIISTDVLHTGMGVSSITVETDINLPKNRPKVKHINRVQRRAQNQPLGNTAFKLGKHHQQQQPSPTTKVHQVRNGQTSECSFWCQQSSLTVKRGHHDQ